ncbi:MAG: DUF3579 domain-containing protein [Gammaproteobacteria bacterium]|nr:DUF3579 domain-containing protein [Gammaproteobacteria bacterium]
MPYDTRYIYIEGDSPTNTRVRPHNWAERFAGNMASYGADRRLRYSPVLEPMVINGSKSLRLCRSLETSQPELFREILGFADHYALRVHGVVTAPELPELAKAS